MLRSIWNRESWCVRSLRVVSEGLVALFQGSHYNYRNYGNDRRRAEADIETSAIKPRCAEVKTAKTKTFLIPYPFGPWRVAHPFYLSLFQNRQRLLWCATWCVKPLWSLESLFEQGSDREELGKSDIDCTIDWQNNNFICILDGFCTILYTNKL